MKSVFGLVSLVLLATPSVASAADGGFCRQFPGLCR